MVTAVIALCLGAEAVASLYRPPPLDHANLVVTIRNVRTTVHSCHWEYERVIDNLGGSGATIEEALIRIRGRSDIRPNLEPFEERGAGEVRVEAWDQVVIPAHVRMSHEEPGCSFVAEGVYRGRDDNGHRFTVNYSFSDSWRP